MNEVKMNSPWAFVLQDNQGIADRKDQKFGRILKTWLETIDVAVAPIGMRSKEVCFRIFSDNFDNVYISAALVLANGRIKGHAQRVPVHMTSHAQRLDSGAYVNAVDRNISEANIYLITEPLIARLEAEYLASL